MGNLVCPHLDRGLNVMDFWPASISKLKALADTALAVLQWDNEIWLLLTSNFEINLMSIHQAFDAACQSHYSCTTNQMFHTGYDSSS